MKKSEAVNFVLDRICGSWELNENMMLEIIDLLNEAGMNPSKYVNPIAIEKGLDDPKWGYINYIDMYPSHHFPDGRPFEYYLDGWEEE